MTDAHQTTIRHDGFTAERAALFLEQLAQRGNVRAACAAIGLSRESAYRLRRRDPLFARGWTAALVLATEVAAEILADRALDGVEEEVWFRGEVVGTRRRFDNRLLLAHLARLDRLHAGAQAQADAARFDEVLACVAGDSPPADLPCPAGGLPAERARAIDQAEEAARDRLWAQENGEDEDECDEPCATDRLVADARGAAAVSWDGWQASARTRVDTLMAGARDVSTVSTSPASGTPAAGTPTDNRGAAARPRHAAHLLGTASRVSPVSTSPLFVPVSFG